MPRGCGERDSTSFVDFPEPTEHRNKRIPPSLIRPASICAYMCVCVYVCVHVWMERGGEGIKSEKRYYPSVFPQHAGVVGVGVPFSLFSTPDRRTFSPRTTALRELNVEEISGGLVEFQQ